MAIVAITSTDRYTNVVEYTGATMNTLNDEMRIHAHSSDFTFAAEVTGSANFKLALEASFDGGTTFFEIDESKTISSAGEYVYYYTGKTTSTIRMKISQVNSGTPDVVPHIAVAYHG